jgi:hypothetical protein
MPRPQVAHGTVITNLANLCPIHLSWAPYFMGFQTPREALDMGRRLVATLISADDQARADPLLDWLRGTCVQSGAGQDDRNRSILEQDFLSTAPDARVVQWMKARIGRYQKEPPMLPVDAASGEPFLCHVL